MARNTRISWADATWNVWDGCLRVSEGCRNCYAERIVRGRAGRNVEWTHAAFTQAPGALLRIYNNRFGAPHSWPPSRVFVESLSDFFLPQIPDKVRHAMLLTMRATPQHRYLILTKRPTAAHLYEYPSNVWLGVSVESERAMWRMDALRGVKQAPLRFVSFEPLLEDVGEIDFTGFAWAIVGGESGLKYRPMEHAWARNIRDQARAQGVAFYFKQSAGPRPEGDVKLKEADGTANVIREYPPEDVPPGAAVQMPLF